MPNCGITYFCPYPQEIIAFRTDVRYAHRPLHARTHARTLTHSTRQPHHTTRIHSFSFAPASDVPRNCALGPRSALSAPRLHRARNDIVGYALLSRPALSASIRQDCFATVVGCPQSLLRSCCSSTLKQTRTTSFLSSGSRAGYLTAI